MTADSTIEVNFTNTSGGELTGDSFWVIAEGTSLTGGDLFKKTSNDPKLGVTTMSSTGGGIVLVSYGNLDVDSMKIWKLDHTGTQADADSWNANADASLGYVIGGTNTIGDSVGVGKTLNVKGGTNTFSASLLDGTLLVEDGTNTFTESISGGSFTAGTVIIGTKSGVTANVNLTGGTVKFTGVTTVGVADATAANFNVTGVALELTNQLKGNKDREGVYLCLPVLLKS